MATSIEEMINTLGIKEEEETIDRIPLLRDSCSVENTLSILNQEKYFICRPTGYLFGVSLPANFIDVCSMLTRTIQEIPMLQVKVNGMRSFMDVWKDDYQFRRALLSHSDPNNGGKWRLQKQFNYRLPTNFTAIYATAMFDYFKSKKVLNPCSGWGNELVGAILAGVEEYVGIDSNPLVFPGYKEIQEVFGTDYTMIKGLFESVAPTLNQNYFDTILTSPPYFEVEWYNDSNPKYKDWITEFYIPFVQNCEKLLEPGGRLLLHFDDPTAGELKAFVEEQITKITKLVYKGVIGSRGVYSEKIKTVWVYEKTK